MADIYEVQHAFQGESGTPRDKFVNTFHAILPVGDVADFPSLCNAIKGFYWNIPLLATVTVGSYLSHTLNGFPATMKVYRVTDPPHTPPVFSTSYDPVAAGADPASSETVPYEVACCLSYNALPTGGVPPGRLRGRIYIGPLNSAALGLDGRPAGGFKDTLLQAGAHLFGAMAAAGGFNWCVYSPTMTAAAGGVPVGHNINRVSVDDAWDTQRRRGNDPTARVSALAV